MLQPAGTVLQHAITLLWPVEALARTVGALLCSDPQVPDTARGAPLRTAGALMWAAGALWRTEGALMQTAGPYCSPLGLVWPVDTLLRPKGPYCGLRKSYCGSRGPAADRRGLLQPAARGGPTAARHRALL